MYEPLVSWSSSNPDVAGVQCGKITAFSAGTTVITANYPNTDEVFTCKVTVVKEGEEVVPEPEELTFSKVVLTENDDNSVTVTAFAKGGRGIKRYWYYVTCNGAVYKKSIFWTAVDSFEFEKPDGAYTVRVYCKDQSGKKLVKTIKAD